MIALGDKRSQSGCFYDIAIGVHEKITHLPKPRQPPGHRRESAGLHTAPAAILLHSGVSLLPCSCVPAPAPACAAVLQAARVAARAAAPVAAPAGVQPWRGDCCCPPRRQAPTWRAQLNRPLRAPQQARLQAHCNRFQHKVNAKLRERDENLAWKCNGKSMYDCDNSKGAAG